MNQKLWHPAYGWGTVQGDKFIFEIYSNGPSAWMRDIQKYTKLYPTTPTGVEKILYKTNPTPFPKYHGFFNSCDCCSDCYNPCTSLIKTNASGGFATSNSLAALKNITMEWAGDWRIYKFAHDRHDRFKMIKTNTPGQFDEQHDIALLLSDLEQSKINYPDFSQANAGERVWSPIWGNGVIISTGSWVRTQDTVVRIKNSQVKVKFLDNDKEEFFFPNGISDTIRGLYPVLFYEDYSSIYRSSI